MSGCPRRTHPYRVSNHQEHWTLSLTTHIIPPVLSQLIEPLPPHDPTNRLPTPPAQSSKQSPSTHQNSRTQSRQSCRCRSLRMKTQMRCCSESYSNKLACRLARFYLRYVPLVLPVAGSHTVPPSAVLFRECRLTARLQTGEYLQANRTAFDSEAKKWILAATQYTVTQRQSALSTYL
jgi:hypothetical protein